MQSKGLSRVFSTTVQKYQFLSAPRTPYLSQDSPGRTELLNYISEVVQSCPTLCDPMDCSLPGFSIHGIFQARVLEWVAISFSINYISCFQIMFCFVFLKQTAYPFQPQSALSHTMTSVSPVAPGQNQSACRFRRGSEADGKCPGNDVHRAGWRPAGPFTRARPWWGASQRLINAALTYRLFSSSSFSSIQQRCWTALSFRSHRSRRGLDRGAAPPVWTASPAGHAERVSQQESRKPLALALALPSDSVALQRWGSTLAPFSIQRPKTTIEISF